MLKRSTVFGVTGLILIVIVFLGVWSLRPSVVGVSPSDEVINQSREVKITISFSHAMRAESVLERLHIEPVMEGSYSWEDKTLIFNPVEGWAKGETIRVWLESGAQSRFYLPINIEQEWHFTVAPTRLAYLWPAGDSADIYALDPESGNVLRFTEAGGVLDYDVDENRDWIYFSALNEDSGSDVLRLDIFSGEIETVLACAQASCSDVQVAPDGSKLVYLRGDATSVGLWLLDLKSGEEEQLSAEGHDVRFPQWAPDGRLSYYDISEGEYRILELASRDVARWENALGEAGAWQPNGVAFIAPAAVEVETDTLRGPSGEKSNEDVAEEELTPVTLFTTHLFEFKLNSGRETDLTGVKLWEDASPAFSPDGLWMAFARRDLSIIEAATARQVWVVRFNGADAHALTADNEYKYLSFAWHPDGSQLAVMRFNNILITEPPEIWLIDVETGDKFRLVIDGFTPSWLP